MGKKSRIKRERKAKGEALPADHKLPPNAADLMTNEFRKQIRNSPMWKQMVEQFGEEEAERLLKKCKAELK